jgi:hypothetical protein
MKRACSVLAMLTLGLISLGANADPITGSQCLNNSCFGSVYTLEYDSGNVIDNGDGTSTYDVFFSIDTSLYTGSGTEIEAVAFKITSDTSVQASLVSAPGGIGAWTEAESNLNANGCNTSANGFVCAEDLGSDPAPVPDGTYVWEFSTTITNGTLLTTTASIQALYNNASEQQAGITSTGITLQTCTTDCGGGGGGGGTVPEPQTLALIGLALVGASVVRARAARR